MSEETKMNPDVKNSKFGYAHPLVGEEILVRDELHDIIRSYTFAGIKHVAIKDKGNIDDELYFDIQDVEFAQSGGRVMVEWEKLFADGLPFLNYEFMPGCFLSTEPLEKEGCKGTVDIGGQIHSEMDCVSVDAAKEWCVTEARRILTEALEKLDV